MSSERMEAEFEQLVKQYEEQETTSKEVGVSIVQSTKKEW